MTKIAAAQFAHDERDSAAAALRQAESAVLDIERAFAADTALARIATVWAKLADGESVLANVAKIKNATLKAQSLWEFSIKATPSGRKTETFMSRAIAATDRIESAFDRAATLARAATGFAEAQRSARARKIFDMAVRESRAIRSSWWRVRILSLLATVLIAM